MGLMGHDVSTSPVGHRPNISRDLILNPVGNLSRNLFLGARCRRERRAGEARTFKRHFRCKSSAPSRHVSLLFS